MAATISTSPELETLGAIYTLLSTSDTLLNSGITTDGTGNRTVTVSNQVNQDTATPYVRLTLTDMLPMDTEPFEYSYVPKAAKVHVMIDVFSDTFTESLNIANVVKNLVQHTEITTTNFHGSTWLLSVDHIEDNTSDPDKIYYHSSLRFEARMLQTT